jgi:peptide/nickel transport system substrate-binding protein
VDKLLVKQSREADKDARRKLVWEIERILVDDAARPIITHGVSGNCWHSYVKGYTAHSNSIYNNTRFEDTWLDK